MNTCAIFIYEEEIDYTMINNQSSGRAHASNKCNVSKERNTYLNLNCMNNVKVCFEMQENAKNGNAVEHEYESFH